MHCIQCRTPREGCNADDRINMCVRRPCATCLPVTDLRKLVAVSPLQKHVRSTLAHKNLALTAPWLYSNSNVHRRTMTRLQTAPIASRGFFAFSLLEPTLSIDAVLPRNQGALSKTDFPEHTGVNFDGAAKKGTPKKMEHKQEEKASDEVDQALLNAKYRVQEADVKYVVDFRCLCFVFS